MNRRAEALEMLEDNAVSALGFTALGISTFDIDRVMEAYRRFFQKPLPEGPFDDSRKLMTDGLHGYILWHIYQDFIGDDKFESFLSEIYPSLIAYQGHIYEEHCLLGNGLIVVDDIIDPLINSLFACANDSILEIGYALGLPSDDLFDQNEMTLHSMNEMLWHQGSGMYQGYDSLQNNIIENHESSGFLPIIGGVPDIDQVLVMVQNAFGDDYRQGGHYSFTSYNLNHSDLDYTVPDRGAISCSMNWLMIQGLARYDMDDLSDVVLEDTLVLLERSGFCSHFDPRKSEHIDNGLGNHQSATSAAIYLHLTKEDF